MDKNIKLSYEELQQKLPENLLEELYHFDSNYVLENYFCGEDNLVLKDSGVQTCRFCKRQKGEVSFGKKAHVFPASMNNSKLTSNFECNNCNKNFGKYENDFGEYFLIDKAIFGLKNRYNKINKHKHPNGSIKIEEVTEEIMMDRYGIKTDLSEHPYALFFSNIDNKMQDIIKNNPKSNRLHYPLVRKSYRPKNVYAIFLKIGFSCLKEEELKNFKGIRKFLTHDKLEVKEDQEYKDQRLSVRVREFSHFYPYPVAHLYDKRKKDSLQDVDKIFVMFWLNKTYQFPIFSDENLRYFIKNKTIRQYDYCPLVGPYRDSIFENDLDTLRHLSNSEITIENFHRTRSVKEETRILTLELQSPANFEGLSMIPTQSSNSK